MKKISYKVDDGLLTIIGNYWEGAHDQAVILLHMMPATKESWNVLADEFHKNGFNVLAIDLRGHGESVWLEQEKNGQRRTIDYKMFSDADHQASARDVEGARKWLVNLGIKPENICIGGASIGANLAIKYMSDHIECPAGFALSPGLNYKGIKTLPLVSVFRPEQKLYIAAAKDDDRSGGSADEQARQIFDQATCRKKTRTFETGGHGTDIFNKHPGLIDELVEWFSTDVKSVNL